MLAGWLGDGLGPARMPGLGLAPTDGDDEGIGRPKPTILIAEMSTTTARPLSQGTGSVNWPSAMTSKWRWQPVEYPVLPTRPTPSPVSTAWPTCTPMAERWL